MIVIIVILKIYVVIWLAGAVIFLFAMRKGIAEQKEPHVSINRAFFHPVFGFVNFIITLYVFPKTVFVAVRKAFVYFLN